MADERYPKRRSRGLLTPVVMATLITILAVASGADDWTAGLRGRRDVNSRS